MIRPALLPACLAGTLLLPGLSLSSSLAETPALRLAQASAIQAPSTVDPGESVVVTLPGGRIDGRIELWGPVTQSGRGTLIDSVPAAATASVSAPMRPGSYELRHVSSGGAIRARQSLDVAAVPVVLSVPGQMGAGLDARVRWHGPANPGDMLQIVDPTTGAVASEASATGVPGEETVTVIRAPEQPGDYYLRYWSGPRGAVLRSLSVTIGQGNAWLRAPLLVHQGERFEVRWHGPVSAEQAFRIVDPLTDTVVSSEPGAEAVFLTAPTRTGAYRMRYVNAQTGHVFADLPLKVRP